MVIQNDKNVLRYGRKATKSFLTLFPKNFQPMKYHYFLAAVLSASLLSAATAQTNHHSKRAIICLTYDDGLQSHINTVLPQLDSLGLKATFFLNSSHRFFRSNQQNFIRTRGDRKRFTHAKVPSTKYK
jgi:peptidoglycan/xylan/chitin deacetylase (PgdA/CDA1 family)